MLVEHTGRLHQIDDRTSTDGDECSRIDFANLLDAAVDELERNIGKSSTEDLAVHP